VRAYSSVGGPNIDQAMSTPPKIDQPELEAGDRDGALRECDAFSDRGVLDARPHSTPFNSKAKSLRSAHTATAVPRFISRSKPRLTGGEKLERG
jgi:hypothetical protein